MPSRGLSLVGFMDQQQAIDHLRTFCVVADPSDQALIAEWNVARAKLGPPTRNAGTPDIQPFPAGHANHLQTLLQLPWVAPMFQAPQPWQGAQFQMVEIAPLLAFQFTVNQDRSATLCQGLSHPPTSQELMEVCLPLGPPVEHFAVTRLPQSVIIKSQSLNLRMLAQGWFQQLNMAGIHFGASLPLVQVTRVNGQCYLDNGFHRAYGAFLAGATHVPCVFRDVPDFTASGVREDGSTFKPPLLESADPPTLNHLVQGLAYDVSLRRTTRILHISWAEYGIADE
jgi:hypothetical protein